jgi:hypothetical protein
MQVEPDYAECVAFLCAREGRKNVPRGTAFFIRIPDEVRKDVNWTYVVTARHCIEDSIKGPNGELYLRITSFEGTQQGYKDIVTYLDDWHRHPAADVAVLLLNPEDEPTLGIRRIPPAFITRDWRFVPEPELYGPKRIQIFNDQVPLGEMPVALGHDLFFPGLFFQSAGTERLLPVVRFGNIARMPTHGVWIPSKFRNEDIEIEAYLVDCQSLGGFSGSPVMWHIVLNVFGNLMGPEGMSHKAILDRVYYRSLLGLVSGHFDLEAQHIHKPTGKRIGELITKINSGLAIVTPAEHIRYMLMEDKNVVGDRRRRLSVIQQEERQQYVAAADFSHAEESTEQMTLAPNPKDRIKIPIITRGQFLKDLMKATRKRDKT